MLVVQRLSGWLVGRGCGRSVGGEGRVEALPLPLCLLLLTDLLLLSEEGEVVLVVPAAVSVVPLDSDHQVCDSGGQAGRQEEEC